MVRLVQMSNAAATTTHLVTLDLRESLRDSGETLEDVLSSLRFRKIIQDFCVGEPYTTVKMIAARGTVILSMLEAEQAEEEKIA